MNIMRRKLFGSIGKVSMVFSRMIESIPVVATKREGWPMAACSVMFQVGSRMEVDDEIGATHFIRTAAVTSGENFTGFMKTRYVHECGGTLSVNTDRQSICFTLSCPPPAYKHLWPYLVDTAYECFYYEWELNDRVRAVVADDLERRPGEEHVLDLVQKACWGGGLYNSVYCSKGRINRMSEDVLQMFTRTHFIGPNCSIGSVGLPFEETQKVVDKIEAVEIVRGLNTIPAPQPIPKSHARAGFEAYDHGPGADTWIAVGVPGVGYEDIILVTKLAILASSIGIGSLHRGCHRYAKIAQTPVGVYCTTDWFTSMKAFSINYRDTGIFGLVVRTKSKYADERAKQVAAYLAHLQVTKEDVDIGKRRLMMDCLRHEQNSARLAEGMALIAYTKHNIETVHDIIHTILSVPSEEVVVEATKISAKCSQMALAIVGDVEAVHNRAMLWSF